MAKQLKIADDRDAISDEEETPRADNARDDVSDVTPEAERPNDNNGDEGKTGGLKGWGKVKELMPSNDIDDQGREKIRVNVAGVRKTVQTQGMNDDQFERFRKNTVNGTDEIDIGKMSELMTANEWKTDTVEEQKSTMGEMRKQITILWTVMSAQTFLLFGLMIVVWWMMKDQFVSDGYLLDSDGNVVRTGSAELRVLSGSDSQDKQSALRTPDGMKIGTVNSDRPLQPCDSMFTDNKKGLSGTQYAMRYHPGLVAGIRHTKKNGEYRWKKYYPMISLCSKKQLPKPLTTLNPGSGFESTVSVPAKFILYESVEAEPVMKSDSVQELVEKKADQDYVRPRSETELCGCADLPAKANNEKWTLKECLTAIENFILAKPGRTQEEWEVLIAQSQAMVKLGGVFRENENKCEKGAKRTIDDISSRIAGVFMIDAWTDEYNLWAAGVILWTQMAYKKTKTPYKYHKEFSNLPKQGQACFMALDQLAVQNANGEPDVPSLKKLLLGELKWGLIDTGKKCGASSSLCDVSQGEYCVTKDRCDNELSCAQAKKTCMIAPVAADGQYSCPMHRYLEEHFVPRDDWWFHYGGKKEANTMIKALNHLGIIKTWYDWSVDDNNKIAPGTTVLGELQAQMYPEADVVDQQVAYCHAIPSETGVPNFDNEMPLWVHHPGNIANTCPAFYFNQESAFKRTLMERVDTLKQRFPNAPRHKINKAWMINLQIGRDKTFYDNAQMMATSDRRRMLSAVSDDDHSKMASIFDIDFTNPNLKKNVRRELQSAGADDATRDWLFAKYVEKNVIMTDSWHLHEERSVARRMQYTPIASSNMDLNNSDGKQTCADKYGVEVEDGEANLEEMDCAEWCVLHGDCNKFNADKYKEAAWFGMPDGWAADNAWKWCDECVMDGAGTWVMNEDCEPDRPECEDTIFHGDASCHIDPDYGMAMMLQGRCSEDNGYCQWLCGEDMEENPDFDMKTDCTYGTMWAALMWNIEVTGHVACHPYDVTSCKKKDPEGNVAACWITSDGKKDPSQCDCVLVSVPNEGGDDEGGDYYGDYEGYGEYDEGEYGEYGEEGYEEEDYCDWMNHMDWSAYGGDRRLKKSSRNRMRHLKKKNRKLRTSKLRKKNRNLGFIENDGTVDAVAYQCRAKGGSYEGVYCGYCGCSDSQMDVMNNLCGEGYTCSSKYGGLQSFPKICTKV